MKVIRVLLKGNFDDAFLYRDRIVAVGTNSLSMFSLSQIAAKIEEIEPKTIPIPTLLFQRNDWTFGKEGMPYRSMVRNPEIANAFIAAARRLKNMEFEAVQFLEKTIRLGTTNDILLDMNIYNGRIYLGGDSGLYDCDLEWEKLAFEKVRHRFDTSCINVSVKYGAVNISCGDEGLHSSLNDFNLDQGPSRSIEKLSDMFQQRSSLSLRSTWCKTNVINYADFSNPQLFDTSAMPVPAGSLEAETSLLTGISETPWGIWNLDRTDKRASAVPSDYIDYTFNSGIHFYTINQAGSIFETSLKYPKSGDRPKLGHFSKIVDGFKGHVIKTLPLRSGAVIETLDKVFLLSATDGIQEVYDSPCLSVRTFPQSRRYKDLFILVTKEGLWLNSVLDADLLDPHGKIIDVEQLKIPINLKRRATDF